MRIHKIIPAVLIVLFSVPCFSQGWVEYKNMVDSFSLNVPATIEPTVEEITWPSEYDAVFPGRIYTFQKDDSLYSVTVIDYTDAFNVHQARTNTTEADARADYEYWRIDVIASIAYAATKIRSRGGSVDYDAWHHIDRVAGHQLNITNLDESRSYVGIYLHKNRLYIIEATVPKGYPPQGHFQQSLAFLDEDGVRIRYDWDANGHLVRSQ
jgi:hypothetical protein